MRRISPAAGVEKVLSTVAAYRPLLLAGRVSLVRGSTTETLWVMVGSPGGVAGDETAVLSFLAQMMASGQAGPYLGFYQRP